ncbi:hypothetical protein SLS58_011052 [Diplodia intermedia]|uniref:Uncharacterized protein n=1 Tax=Diplodia intermedia TaxID=856260 RepID=A0ABR3T1X9_9PEZI
MCVPAIGYTNRKPHLQAKRAAVQNQLPTGNFVLIHVDLVDDKAPAVFGKLASEYSSYALRSTISTVVEAKAIDVVMRVDKSMMTSLRERDVQRTMRLKTIPPDSTHSATFHRIGATQVFIVQLRLSRLSNETTKPAEGCRLQLKRPNSETKYEA